MAILVLGIAAATALPIFSQDTQPPPKNTAPKVGQRSVTGTVTSYEVASSIEITSGSTTKKYDLNDSDTVYSISPEVAVGRTVTAIEIVGDEGHKSVTIALAAVTK